MLKKLLDAMFCDRNGYVSRKLIAAWMLTGLTTSITLLHVPFLTFTSVAMEPVLTGDHYAQMLTVIWGTYFAVNTIDSVAHRNNE